MLQTIKDDHLLRTSNWELITDSDSTGQIGNTESVDNVQRAEINIEVDDIVLS